MIARLRSSTRRPARFSCDSARRQHGFTLLELVLVVAIIIVVSAIALPNLQVYLQNYRIAGDARRIASQLALARMRSAGDFNEERVNIDQTGRTFEMDVCTKSTGTWINDSGGTALPLSPGVSFGYGDVSTGPTTSSQTTIAQTAPITFNSRGVPVILSGPSCNNGCSPPPACVVAPSPQNVIYLSGAGGLYYAVTVNISGKIDVWRYSSSAWQMTGY